MSNLLEGLSQAQERFEKDFDVLLTSTEGGLEGVYTKLAAELQVNDAFDEEVNECLKQHNVTGPSLQHRTRAALVDARFRQLCFLFLRLHYRGAFTFSTDNVEAEIERVERRCGLRKPTPPPPAPPTAEELLEEQVVSDYNKLATDAFKRKLNGNAAYRTMYQRLAETDRLASRATTLHDKVGG